jgi:hypothetical protein
VSLEGGKSLSRDNKQSRTTNPFEPYCRPTRTYTSCDAQLFKKGDPAQRFLSLFGLSSWLMTPARARQLGQAMKDSNRLGRSE